MRYQDPQGGGMPQKSHLNEEHQERTIRISCAQIKHSNLGYPEIPALLLWTFDITTQPHVFTEKISKCSDPYVALSRAALAAVPVALGACRTGNWKEFQHVSTIGSASLNPLQSCQSFRDRRPIRAGNLSCNSSVGLRFAAFPKRLSL